MTVKGAAAEVVPLLALLFPSRIVAGLFAVLLGGAASNVIDMYLWPGGAARTCPVRAGTDI